MNSLITNFHHITQQRETSRWFNRAKTFLEENNDFEDEVEEVETNYELNIANQSHVITENKLSNSKDLFDKINEYEGTTQQRTTYINELETINSNLFETIKVLKNNHLLEHKTRQIIPNLLKKTKH